MKNLEQNSRVGLINSFLKLEPDAAFGSAGPRCLKCGAMLSYYEFISVTSFPEDGQPVYKLFLTDKHKCEKRVIKEQ